MPTPVLSGYVELVGASSTLLLGSQAIMLQDATDLLSVGSSRGGNLAAGGVDGALIRARYRGDLPVNLKFYVDGAYDQDGARVADPETNGFQLVRLVSGWPDSEDRQATIRLTYGTTVLEGLASFEEFGQWTHPDNQMWFGAMLWTVAAGRLDQVAP